MNTPNNPNQACPSDQNAAGSAKMVASVLTALMLAGVAFTGCRNRPAESPIVVQPRKQADTNLLELARQLERTLHQAVDIHAAGSDTNRLLKELKKIRE